MKNLLLAILTLSLLNSCTSGSKDKIGKYQPMPNNGILDTETGTMYWTEYGETYQTRNELSLYKREIKEFDNR